VAVKKTQQHVSRIHHLDNKGTELGALQREYFLARGRMQPVSHVYLIDH
jgi:hypothetical protein